MSKPLVPINPAKLHWHDASPYSTDFADIYFSKENGLAEKQYVFLDGNDLQSRWQNLNKSSFCIGETGFGTGLNFLLTCTHWLQYASIDSCLYYYSCEKHPLSRKDLQQALKLWPELTDLSAQLIEQYPILTPGFHHLSFAQGRIKLILMLGNAIDCFRELLLCGDKTLESSLTQMGMDAWYLDGFSPKKNGQMWDKELLSIIALLSREGTTLATYTVANIVKANIQSVGFILEKRKGFADKRSMLTAQFVSALYSDKPRNTPWHVSTKGTPQTKKALIVGAGLAGCFAADALAKRGWKVTLLEKDSVIAQGASGNQQAVLYPQFSAYQSPLTVFMLQAYLFALPVYKRLLQHKIGAMDGIFQLAYNEKEQSNQMGLKPWIINYPELARLMNANEASSICGVSLQKGGMFIPDAGWFNIPKLCSVLIDHPNIDVRCNSAITDLRFHNNEWHVADCHAETVILANGFHAAQYEQTCCIPMKAIGGQLTFIAPNQQSSALKIPLCASGHVVPQQDALHAIGATYHLDVTTIHCNETDDRVNQSRLRALPASVDWSEKVMGSWCGIRAATPDYLPVVGAVPDAYLFNKRFACLADNAKRWLPVDGAYLPGLYICAGFGSRGLTTAPLCAELLAELINNEPKTLSQPMIKSLSPARFLLKQIIRSGNHDSLLRIPPVVLAKNS